jgi:Phospholipase_D-nuclease N-terminal
MRGIFALLILIADIWAIVNVVQSGETTVNKVVWILLILVLPLVGLLIWYFAGPRPGRGDAGP